jgi:glycosyltransferase involved in cell wall biosynthesis
MRVLYVGPFPPSRDGIGAYTGAMANTVRQAGHEIGVVVPRSVPDCPREVIGALRWGSGKMQGFSDIAAKWRPDVVHIQFAVGAFGTRTPLLLTLVRLLHRKSSAIVIITMHEVTRDTALLGVIGRMLYRMLAQKCDRIIVHTNAAHDALARMGVPSAKTVIIPHPVARPPRAGSTPADLRTRFVLGKKRILLAFGYVHVDKGLNDLVSALGIVKRSMTVPLHDVQLVVAGAVRPRRGMFRLFEIRDRIHLARVRRKAHRDGLDQYLVLTGYVPDEDVAAWFQTAEAAVLPYRRIEQSGVAALASAFGIPVLASTAGGLGEYYAGSRWTFPPRRPDCLASVLADFLTAAPEERGNSREQMAPDLNFVAAATIDLYLAGRG